MHIPFPPARRQTPKPAGSCQQVRMWAKLFGGKLQGTTILLHSSQYHIHVVLQTLRGKLQCSAPELHDLEHHILHISGIGGPAQGQRALAHGSTQHFQVLLQIITGKFQGAPVKLNSCQHHGLVARQWPQNGPIKGPPSASCAAQHHWIHPQLLVCELHCLAIRPHCCQHHLPVSLQLLGQFQQHPLLLHCCQHHTAIIPPVRHQAPHRGWVRAHRAQSRWAAVTKRSATEEPGPICEEIAPSSCENQSWVLDIQMIHVHSMV